jgi:hypothetical protein
VSQFEFAGIHLEEKNSSLVWLNVVSLLSSFVGLLEHKHNEVPSPSRVLLVSHLWEILLLPLLSHVDVADVHVDDVDDRDYYVLLPRDDYVNLRLGP